MTRVHRIVITVAAMLAITAPAASARMMIGISDPAQENSLSYWQTLVTLQAQETRLWVSWPDYVSGKPHNPTNPSDPAYKWGPMDQKLQFAQQAGWHGTILVTVFQTPSWAHRYPHQRGSFAVPNPAAYAAFVTALAKRYNGTFTPNGALAPLPAIQAVTVWNEPNTVLTSIRGFQVGAWMPLAKDRKNWAGEYVDVLNATYKAVHALPRPRPAVLGGEIGGYQGMYHKTFFDTMVRDHALMDGIALHPYPQNPAQGVYDGTTPSSGWFDTGDFGYVVSRIQKWRGKRFRIWITEIAVQGNPPNANAGVSWPKQNLYMKQSAALFKHYPQVVAYTWYQLVDATTYWQSGLVTASGKHRPIWNTFMQLTGALPTF